ncbi:type II toxin-antitoxin system VapB family antitoxin [Amycolatopsis pithecellobii]|uniref:DUF2191 domain-containing protein n=1 Tax=Amycolatopsis pithecellobii TaxID=664692 RepID=A0A6N7YL56_9PSEU|nr:type II toxin-antitoxin system VapB family antitoxin [Amycolatopsis pithecellobii]MTD53655.1 DUF2191 domain-containing protein [Amycolatopsis pithecellobii]
MRTTVNIDDTLLREAKSLAMQSGRPLGAVVDDALRVFISRAADAQRTASTFHLPTGGEGGLQPGVDLDDKEQLAALLDEDIQGR